MFQDIIAVFQLQTRFKANFQKPIKPWKSWHENPDRRRCLWLWRGSAWWPRQCQDVGKPKCCSISIIQNTQLDLSTIENENLVILVLNHHEIFGWDQSTNPEHGELTPDPPGRQGLQRGNAATWFQTIKVSRKYSHGSLHGDMEISPWLPR